MTEASTRLSALQTQQQFGVQALSVANQNSQLIRASAVVERERHLLTVVRLSP